MVTPTKKNKKEEERKRMLSSQDKCADLCVNEINGEIRETTS